MCLANVALPPCPDESTQECRSEAETAVSGTGLAAGGTGLAAAVRAVPVASTKRNKPWLTLVSYVDELTVGGRRDSQGRYVDGLGRFPGFGRKAKDLTPQDCFPQHCFQR